MADQAWRTAWQRWGDQLWSLALVRCGDRAAARQALVRAFVRVYAAGTPSTDAHAALLQALLQQRRSFHFTRARDLPRALRCIPPVERTLLALWLVQDGDGQQLITVSGWTHQTLVQRLATALRPLLPRGDGARRTNAGQAAFEQWLAHQLNLPSAPLPDTTNEPTTAAWQQALSRVRDLLATTLNRHRAPGTLRDAIETALTARDEETPAWQQRLGWLALVALVIAGGWILRSSLAARSTTNTAAPPAPVDARTVVKDAIDTWTTTPVSGTLHRQVWAVDPSIPDAPALVTNVWLQANSARYRVETTRDGTLVEWQIGDGTGQVQYAARAGYSACRWGDEPSTRATLVFNADATQQAAVRDARLQQGGYGRGYQMLQTALGAPDLRSWGTRTENNVPVLLLGYNDPALPNRQRMLVFDARTRRLQAVRELASNATQTTARDLWRVDKQELLGSEVSAVPPRRPGTRLNRDQILDPKCLDLDEGHVLSVRALVGSDTGWWLPTRLPPDVEAAALISNDSVTPQTVATWQSQTPNARAVFVGSERVLHIGMQRTFVRLEGSVARGPWRVVFEHDQQTIRAQLCRPSGGAETCPFDEPSLVIEAQNWTEEQLLSLIDSLAPAGDASTWVALDPLFVDPHPLDPQVQQVLAQALDRSSVAQGVVHSTVEITHTGAAQSSGVENLPPGPLSDPYAVPRQWLAPEQISVEQTVVMSDGVVQQARAATHGEDGTLLSARVIDNLGMVSYDAVQQTVSTMSVDKQNWLRQTLKAERALAFDRMQAFTASMLPITLRDAGDTWVLQQQASNPDPYQLNIFMGRSVPSQENTGSGLDVERLWIDKHTGLLRRGEVVQLDAQNRETVLSALHVVTWQVQPLDADADLPMPPLPPNTIAYTYGDFGPTVTSDLQPFMPPPNEWVWRDGFEVTNRNNRNRPFDSMSAYGFGSEAQRQMFAATVLSASLEQLESVGLIHGTTYRVPGSTTTIMVRQGAAPLLRYVLRSQALGNNGTLGWKQSRAVRVTIGGQERTAWLLESDIKMALVVEVDNVIVHISSLDKAYMEGALLDRLPQLQLVDAAAWKGNP